MSRVELGGHEGPHPLEALPSVFTGDAPSYSLVLSTGNFIPHDYIRYGYTHYEVSAIGATGGLGGDVRDLIEFTATHAYETVPSNAWSAFIEVNRIWYGSQIFVQDQLPNGTYGNSHYISVEEYVERLYPDHKYQRDFYTAPALKTPLMWGGAGGGGGLHIISGRLVDLPDIVPVVVGQAGVDGEEGQRLSSGVVTPLPHSLVVAGSNPFWLWQSVYNPPRASFSPPQRGSDGGASSFNGSMCVASGGKGGEAAIRWDENEQLHSYGTGGDGGTGGQSAAGGGAVGGSIMEGILVEDGTWDGVVGKGGGGGHGGSKINGYSYSPLNSQWLPRFGNFNWNAGDGGRGSFSYSDTSVFGPRQRKQPITLEDGEPIIVHDGDPLTIIWETPTIEVIEVIGGGGGGANRGGWKNGSHAIGYSPDGLVLIRMFKLN